MRLSPMKNEATVFQSPEQRSLDACLRSLKARWLARHSRVRHTILSPNVDSGGEAPTHQAAEHSGRPRGS